MVYNFVLVIKDFRGKLDLGDNRGCQQVFMHFEAIDSIFVALVQDRRNVVNQKGPWVETYMLVVEIKNKKPSNLIIMKSDLADHMKY